MSTIAKVYGLFLVLCLLAAAPRAEAEVITLQNDSLSSPLLDGVVSCGFIVNEYVAAIFEPPADSYPLQLLEVQFFLSPNTAGIMSCPPTAAECGLPFPLRVWKDDTDGQLVPSGSEIYTDLDLTVCSSNLSANTITIDETVTIEDGLFRVAFEFPDNGVAFPLRDTAGAEPNRNLVYGDFGGDFQWQWANALGVFGDWVIRVVVDTNTSSDSDTDTDSDSDSDSDTDSDSDVDSDSDTDTDVDTGCIAEQCDETCVNNGFEGGSCRDGECECLGENRDDCGCLTVGRTGDLGGLALLLLAGLGLVLAFRRNR